MHAHRHVHVRIEGRVQGVGFRVFVQREATARGVVGMVRNRRDGGVEAYLSGTASALDATLAALQRGPHGAVVALLKAFAVDAHAWSALDACVVGTTV